MSKILAKRNPSSVAQTPFGSFFSRTMFDNMFDQFLNENDNPLKAAMDAAMDVAETEQAFEVKMDLPGVETENVDIQIDNNTLTVRGQRSEEKEEKDDKKQYHRVERYSGSFSRSIVLPYALNENETAAEFKNGVLRIVIPKSEDAKPRKIKIKG